MKKKENTKEKIKAFEYSQLIRKDYHQIFSKLIVQILFTLSNNGLT